MGGTEKSYCKKKGRRGWKKGEKRERRGGEKEGGERGGGVINQAILVVTLWDGLYLLFAFTSYLINTHFVHIPDSPCTKSVKF